MTLVEVAPSDDMRLILCFASDRRVPFDVVANYKQSLNDRARVALPLEASGAFNPVAGAAPCGGPTTAIRNLSAAGGRNTALARDPRTVPATNIASRKEWIR